MYPNRFIPLAVLCFVHSISSIQAQELTHKKQQLPLNWHSLSPVKTGFYGVAVDQAYEFLDSLKLKPKKITVAVIDADLNVNHEDLKARIWKNPKPGSKGYRNDINGWNFLGNKDGRSLVKTGTEAFREYKRLRPVYEYLKPEEVKTPAQKQEYAYFLALRKEAKINSYVKFGDYLQQITNAFEVTDSIIKATKFDQQPSVTNVLTLKNSDPKLAESLRIVQESMYKYEENASWKDVYAAQQAESNVAMNRIKSLDSPAGPRDVIGDKNDLKDKFYGNANLFEPNTFHGTFVAGLIAAVRNNGIGIDGIADSVAIMGVRAIPDGDEYDKDVALAIRYAVDNGAKLINMSFAKYLSPNSGWVNDAISYAGKKGVLMIHAAGNDGKNIDSTIVYPSGMESAIKRSASLIRVGASTPSGEAASISNYGAANVDVFAPGMDIRSTGLNNGYQMASGTSLSAPIVTGVAALLWSYFPKLTAAQVRQILLASVTSRKGQETSLPGKGKSPKTAFENLCVSAGIVNANQAVRMAERLTR